jgi:hypothetical protein
LRDYGKIYTRFWTQPDIRALSNHGKLVAAYLLTCPHTTMIGCFRLPLMYVCADLDWQQDAVQKAIVELHKADWLRHDAAHEWVNITNFLKYNPIENPNQGKAALKLVKDVPRTSPIWAALIKSIELFGGAHFQPLLEGLGTVAVTVAKPLPNQEQEQKQKQKPEKQSAPQGGTPPTKGRGTRIPDDFKVSDAHRTLARELGANADAEIIAFTDHFKSKAGADGVKLDWDAAFRNWLRNSLKYGGAPAPARAAKPPAQPEPPRQYAPSMALPKDLDAEAGRRAWDGVLDAVKGSISTHSFDTWLKPIRGAGVCKSTRTLYAKVPTPQFMDAGERYGDQLQAAVTRLGLDTFKFFHDVEV